MRLLDHINAPPGFSAAQHLAADEVLLAAGVETLRIWEASEAAVIVGRSSRVETEVNLARCEELGVPVLRRCSGGCAIVAGLGCLMYTVVLDLRRRPGLRVIDQAHDYVLERILAALDSAGIEGLAREGLSDLVLTNGDTPLKFSGNSLRITRDALLYHGTILYDFPIEQISDLLRKPPREPTYRNQRQHQQFVTNIDMDRDQVVNALGSAWQAAEPMGALSTESVDTLVAEKYAQREWNYRH